MSFKEKANTKEKLAPINLIPSRATSIEKTQTAASPLPKPANNFNQIILNSPILSNYLKFPNKASSPKNSFYHHNNFFASPRHSRRLSGKINFTNQNSGFNTKKDSSPDHNYIEEKLNISSNFGFKPFHEIVFEDEDLRNRILDHEQNTIRSNQFFNDQISHNKQQVEFYKNTIEKSMDITYNTLLNDYVEKEKKNKKIFNKTRIFQKKPIKFTDVPTVVGKVLQKKDSYLKEGSINLYVTHSSENGLLPAARESSVFVNGELSCGYNTGILYSGLSHKLHEDLWLYDLANDCWKQMELKGNLAFYGRFGHSMSYYKNKKCFVLFGGSLLYSGVTKNMDCLDDVAFYIPTKKRFAQVKCNGDPVEQRRDHVAEIISSFLVIHGGINTKEEYLSDVICLDLEKGKWVKCEIEIKIEEANGIAYHKSCYVGSEKRLISIYKEDFSSSNPENFADYDYENSKKEGIYMFGGRTDEGVVRGCLRVLLIGQKPLKWYVPETYGEPPEPRFQHTMTYVKKAHSIFIYGGRNDRFELFHKNAHMIDLKSFTWITCILHGDKVIQRFLHTAYCSDTKVLIFGGMHYDLFATSQVEIIEFDPYIVKKKVKEDIFKSTWYQENHGAIIDQNLNAAKPNGLVANKEKFEELLKKFKFLKNNRDKTKRDNLVSFLPVPSLNNEKSHQYRRNLLLKKTKFI